MMVHWLMTMAKKFVTLKDCSDIWLEHLKELEIVGFACQKAEMEFVKLIFAKSPVLRKVKMILDKKVTTDEELIKRILSGSPCVSPLAEMIVERQRIAKKILFFSSGCPTISELKIYQILNVQHKKFAAAAKVS
ncbi:F-box/FBD/LRR-repeat protein-like protein [Tanacetum coccineum]